MGNEREDEEMQGRKEEEPIQPQRCVSVPLHLCVSSQILPVIVEV